MPLLTTVIGSYPKPDYLTIPDWFGTSHFGPFIEKYTKYVEQSDEKSEELVRRATKEVLNTQASIGIDIVTDGEMRRESYVHYFCRHLVGMDFAKLTEKECRGGATKITMPTVTGEIKSGNDVGWMAKEWRIAQDMTDKPVKATLPGPMTIINSIANEYYKDDVRLSEDLVRTLNREIIRLADAGCKYIQVDAPVLVRFPDEALRYGIDHLAVCFEGVPDDVTKCIHLCCGYPQRLDQEDYAKADPGAYLKIADKLDAAGFDHISLEDAHRHNGLELFQHFKKSKIVLGVVKIASSKIENVEDIKARLRQVLSVFPAERLIVAPDCGLGLLSDGLAQRKLKNMAEAAQAF